jgi:hypothetical protein
LVVVPGIDTIDATAVDTSFMGHSYFAETRSVLEDIYALMTTHQRARRRFGVGQVVGVGGPHCSLALKGVFDAVALASLALGSLRMLCGRQALVLVLCIHLDLHLRQLAAMGAASVDQLLAGTTRITDCLPRCCHA